MRTVLDAFPRWELSSFGSDVSAEGSIDGFLTGCFLTPLLSTFGEFTAILSYASRRGLMWKQMQEEASNSLRTIAPLDRLFFYIFTCPMIILQLELHCVAASFFKQNNQGSVHHGYDSDEWNLLRTFGPTLGDADAINTQHKLHYYIANGDKSGAHREAILECIRDVEKNLSDDSGMGGTYLLNTNLATPAETFMAAADAIENDDLASKYATYILHTLSTKCSATSIAHRVLARTAHRRGESRNSVVQSYRAACKEAMDGHLYGLAFVIGRECSGAEGQQLAGEACAALGKSRDLLEAQYTKALEGHFT
jgi:hypothetical protein